MDRERLLQKLIDIGVALSSERNLNTLMKRILTESRNYTGAEAGTLYLKEKNQLLFFVTQNEKMGLTDETAVGSPAFKKSAIPLTTGSIAGYVGSTGQILNIADVYEIPPNCPYSFNREFDLRNAYRSRSMLIVPMKDEKGQVVGVIQLINARCEDHPERIVRFDPRIEPLVMCLASQAAVAVRNVKLNQELATVYLDTIMRLSMAAEFKDQDTAAHIKRMSLYSAIIARTMGMEDRTVDLIRMASPMHDIGKIGIADAILTKPGKLTDEEYDEMKKHTLIGAVILGNSDSELLQLSEKIALTHHEKWDGSGYPNGLTGEEIPLVGRIVAMADVFDALTSKRCYKDAFPIERAVDIIENDSGTHFDPQVVDAFLEALPEIVKVKEKYTDTAVLSMSDSFDRYPVR